jgi:hypothetical protein
MIERPMDIFRIEKGHPLWLEAAESMAAAIERVTALATQHPGEYIIFNQRTQTKRVCNYWHEVK